MFKLFIHTYQSMYVILKVETKITNIPGMVSKSQFKYEYMQDVADALPPDIVYCR